MKRPDIPYEDSPNRSRGLWPRGVVIHYTAGSYQSAVNWFSTTRSRVSAHFIVAKDGRAVQMVPLPDPDPPVGSTDGRVKAWHARDGNSYYVGIEHEGNGRPEEWTDAMLNTSAHIAAWCAHIYDFPVEHVPQRGLQAGFKGHSEVQGNDHTDPGPHFPWQDYLFRVQAFLEEGVEEPEPEEPEEDDDMTKEDIREVLREELALWPGVSSIDVGEGQSKTLVCNSDGAVWLSTSTNSKVHYRFISPDGGEQESETREFGLGGFHLSTPKNRYLLHVFVEEGGPVTAQSFGPALT